MVDAIRYYANYEGHPSHMLRTLEKAIRTTTTNDSKATAILYLVGDSTLDNKHWLFAATETKEAQLRPQPASAATTAATAHALNGYEHHLRPPVMVQDVAFWLNRLAAERLGSQHLVTLNCAVEESTRQPRSVSM